MFNFRLLKYIYIRIYVLNKMEDESDSDSSVDELKIQQLKEAAVCAESIVTECKSKIVILVPLFISFIWRMNISQTRYQSEFSWYVYVCIPSTVGHHCKLIDNLFYWLFRKIQNKKKLMILWNTIQNRIQRFII